MLTTVCKLLLISALSLIGLTLANQTAFAQQSPAAGAAGSGAANPGSGPSKGSAGSAKGGNKKTTINFEDQLVEGQTQKPELFYLLQQRNNNFKRLIRLRENFLPEMRKTSEDIGRSGKGSGH